MAACDEAPENGPPQDPLAQAALAAYLSERQAGRCPDRAALLAKYPALASVLASLEEGFHLQGDCIVASASGPSGDAPTLPPDGLPAGSITFLPSSATQFGKYELLEIIGRGGMGVVYRARQTDLDRMVAVKMILGGALIPDGDLQRFQAESRAAGGLHHPHILQVYEAGAIAGQHYFAMQLIEGPSLAQRLERGPMAPDAAAKCLAAVARAVAYLHGHGIVHRDLKPGNIMLDRNDWPYVTDFGLVKWLSAPADRTGTGAVLGTPSYMAPEQAAGQNVRVGPQSDIYSLGAILYEMLTGRPPFREATPLDTLVQVLEGEPPSLHEFNPRIPRELEWICQKAMAKISEQRYASADALAEDLEHFLKGEMVAAQPQSWAQRLARWTRQEPGLVSHLAVLGACAAIAQIYYLIAHPATLATHSLIMAILGAWALTALACQAWIRKNRQPDLGRGVWLTFDALWLTLALCCDQAFHSPLALTYAVFIVASGLWFRVGFVWLATGLALAGYGCLLAVGQFQHALGNSPQHYFIVIVGLIVLGLMVAAQVKRVRALSRYYENRPLP